MPYQLDRAIFDHLKQRLEAISADARPKWGKLTPAGLMAHLDFAIAVSLGEVPVTDTSNLFMRTVGKFLAFHVITHWPGGVLKAPDEWTPEPKETLEAERAKAIGTMKRFIDAADAEPTRKTISPLLGPLTLQYWRRVHALHLIHHFRQFGV